jgi:hypothetical protein
LLTNQAGNILLYPEFDEEMPEMSQMYSNALKGKEWLDG